jgi:hypothetical protein
MRKIEFIVTNNLSIPNPLSDKHLLLAYFIDDYRYIGPIDDLIGRLESVHSGQKNFSDIHNPSSIWDVGEDSGDFECDKDIAYFHAEEDSALESFEMPLAELIDLFKEWKLFLLKNNAG